MQANLINGKNPLRLPKRTSRAGLTGPASGKEQAYCDFTFMTPVSTDF